MTRAEFEKIIGFLEGACRTELKSNERDAYWLLLNAEPGSVTMERAVQFCQDRERARFGFPRPADLLPTQREREWAETMRRIDAPELDRLANGERKLLR